MNKVIGILVLACVVSGVAFAAFTDTDIAKNHGKTGLKNLTSQIDANFASIEGGTEAIAGSTLGLTTNGVSAGVFQVVGTALQFVSGGVTNVIDADITSGS
jgi:hypothetical protein